MVDACRQSVFFKHPSGAAEEVACADDCCFMYVWLISPISALPMSRDGHMSRAAVDAGLGSVVQAYNFPPLGFAF